ncbi:MAG TPA: DNA protecting protein DprA, partial [Candidatus Accumulibacter sp.]|nr:DNA protecting protein DprA [Accumulibacter sp.]
MSNVLSNNTQAILLLTAPLITGRSEPTRELLTPSEYKRLARHLHQLSKEPADLLSSDADEILRQGQAVVDAARLKRLLGRGFALSQAIDRWQARGIWVVSRADSNYPQRLRDRLREDRPAVLYGCGERTILERGGLAVVGSRDVDEALVEYTESIGRLTAKARKTLVSGGARGIDQAAMRGALEAGGMVSGVLADGLEKSAMNRDHRRLLMDGQLVLVSPYDPGAGFNVGNAMQRNKLIYALADAALVVNSDVEKGGTWAGAVEQLGKLKFVPVFVRSTGSASTGLTALLNKGAFPWPNPDDADGLVEALAFAPSTTRASALPSQLTLAADDDPSTDAPPSPVVPPAPVLLSTTPMPESPEVEMAVAAPAASSLPPERDPADDLY